MQTGSGGALPKRFEQGGEGSSGVVAVAAPPGAAAIYEVRAEARRASVIAPGNTGTLQRELEAAGARGQCIVGGDGVKEALYVLEECAQGAAARSYEVISATKTGTFEREINAAAARGMRFVPASLLGIEKRVLGNPYNYETVGVVERSGDARFSARQGAGGGRGKWVSSDCACDRPERSLRGSREALIDPFRRTGSAPDDEGPGQQGEETNRVAAATR